MDKEMGPEMKQQLKVIAYEKKMEPEMKMLAYGERY